MRYLSLFICLVLLLSSFSVNGEEEKIDFSGEWTLNSEKSEFGESFGRGRGSGMAADKMIIEQKEKELVVESFRKNRNGEDISTKLTYRLDGKKSKNDLAFGEQVSVAKWSKDGKTLIIESTMEISRRNREFTIESTQKWTLENGLLKIESTRSTPRGEGKSKLIYTKVVKEN